MAAGSHPNRQAGRLPYVSGVVLDFIIVASVPVPADIISWWRAEDNANDATTNNHGSLQNGSTFANGKVGQAFSFGGSNNVIIGDAPDLNPTSALTIEVWVFMTEENWDHRDIVSKDGEWSDRQYLLTVSDISRFRAHVWTVNGTNYFDGNTEVAVDTWYHVAMTYDGQWLKLFVNGILDGSSSASTGAVVTTSQPMRLGGRRAFRRVALLLHGPHRRTDDLQPRPDHQRNQRHLLGGHCWQMQIGRRPRRPD